MLLIFKYKSTKIKQKENFKEENQTTVFIEKKGNQFRDFYSKIVLNY